MYTDINSVILNLVTSEKEVLLKYKSLCSKIGIQPDPVAEMISKGKVEVLTSLSRMLKQKSALQTKG